MIFFFEKPIIFANLPVKNVNSKNSPGVFFKATQTEVAIGIFADNGLTGHRIDEKQSAFRMPTL